jgi:ER membrane protein complex subunit 7
MRAEWEERQKSSPMNSIMGGGAGQPGANPMGNFDMAAFLAGSQKKGEGNDNGSGAKADNKKRK